MPTTTHLLLFLAAGLTLNITPGPDMLYVISRSSTEGPRAGVVSSLGIAAGTLVHIAAVTLGLSSLLAAVPVAYDVVRLAGAAYLIYLGVRTLAGTGGLIGAAAVAPAGLWPTFRQGVITNVLNPKVALFFLAFLPQFVDRDRGPIGPQLCLLGLLFDTTGTMVNIGVAVAAGHAAVALRRSDGPARWLRRTTGAVFLGLGLRLAFASRR